MLNNFFVNILLLVSVTFVGGHIIKEISDRQRTMLWFRLLIGVFCGMLGILLMVYSVPVNEANTIVDLRFYAIMISSYAGGFLPTLISGLAIGMFRILFYGNHVPYEIVIVQLVGYISTFYLVDRFTKVGWKSWLFKTAVSIVVAMSTYYLLLKNVTNILLIMSEYIVIIVIAGFLEFFLLESVRTSNELYRKYKMDSTNDFLTGLTNTRQFDKKLNLAMEHVQQNKESLTCLMIDIDFFKKVNDTYGHAIGDVVLKELGDILKKHVRTTDVIARVGGEEFCALLFNCTKEQSFEIALAINKVVRDYHFPIGDNQFINITVSVGISMYPMMTTNPEQLKEMADTALYKAKRSGRNRVCDYETCMVVKDESDSKVE